MKTAACYIRVSTDDQTEYSPDSQLKLIEDYAQKNHIILLKDFIFAEDGGVSGKSIKNRTKFAEMIATAKRKPKPFDIILVWKFSRFARNQEEAIVLKSVLKRNEIDVISISEPLPEGPFGSLVERIIEWTDAYYLTNLSEEVKRGMREKAERGLPVSNAPLGYKLQNGTYVPDDNADCIKNIFNDYANGLGLRSIAQKYSAFGIRTKRGNPLDNRGIEYILRNPIYIGKVRWSIKGHAASKRHYNDPNIMITDGKHKPIVDIDLFNTVQKRLDEQKRIYGKYQRSEQPIEYMLKGLVRCNNCNATLVLMHTKKPSLQCHNYARGSCHTSHNISVEKANEAVIEYLRNAAISENFSISSSSDNRNQDIVDLKKLIASEYSRLDRIKTAYQNGIDTLDEYKENKERVRKSISRLEKSLNDINKQKELNIDKSNFCDRIFNVLNVICDSKQSEKAKNTALRTIVEKIVYFKPDNRFEIYFYE